MCSQTVLLPLLLALFLNSHLIIIFPSCIKNEGTTGRDTIYLAAPEDRAWSEGISRPGRCAHGDLYSS